MNTISCFFTVLCAVVLPVGAAVFLCVKSRRLVKPLLLGAATFFLFQILLRLPLLQLLLSRAGWLIVMSTIHPLWYSLFLGFTAGLFEELGRYIVMRLFMKNALDTTAGLAFGLGHGGIEALLLVGVNAVATLILYSGSVTPSLMFAGGVERLITLVLHICWSLMVAKAVRERKAFWLLFALATHTLIDTGAACASYFSVPVWYTELALVLCALVAGWYIVNEFKKEKRP